MLDVQLSIRDYYDATGATQDLEIIGSRLRQSVCSVQRLNELLGVAVRKRHIDFRQTNAEPHKELTFAFKYLRNVLEHVTSLVRPVPQSMIGNPFGHFRIYHRWAEVDPWVHNELRSASQDLAPFYDMRLRGKWVTGTLLDAAKTFGGIHPDLVHRDHQGEWLGFPLPQHDDVSERLHPEEPEDHRDALAWMNGRRPGGDFRMICGTLSAWGSTWLVGFTFSGNRPVCRFFETPAQVDCDIAMGFPYHRQVSAEELATVMPNPPPGQPIPFGSLPGRWIENPLKCAPAVEPRDRGVTAGFGEAADWLLHFDMERFGPRPEDVSFLARRDVRMCARRGF